MLAEADAGVLVATLKCAKLGEYEATVLENELSNLSKGLAHKIAMDFTRVEMIASAGLGMLVSLQRKCKGAKGKLVLFGMNENLRGVLKITRMDALFTFQTDRGAAVKAAT